MHAGARDHGKIRMNSEKQLFIWARSGLLGPSLRENNNRFNFIHWPAHKHKQSHTLLVLFEMVSRTNTAVSKHTHSLYPTRFTPLTSEQTPIFLFWLTQRGKSRVHPKNWYVWEYEQFFIFFLFHDKECMLWAIYE